jgi:cell division protein FtsW (lipid II flippase)
MKFSSNIFAKIAIVLQLIFALVNIYYTVSKLYEPKGIGEFSLIKNAATDFYILVAIFLSGILVLCAYYLFKYRLWAFFTSIVILLLCIPVLALGQMYGLIFELSAGAPLSLTSEILPVIVVLVHAMSYKKFMRKG